MKIKIILSLFLLAFCSAQTKNFVARQWNIEDGLPQSSIRCITQTHDGYLWIGTWNGLARFDGVRMTVFNALNTPKLHPSIIDIYEDKQHRLWIGTDGGGLLQYKNDSLVWLDSADGIPAKVINSIKEDSAGNVWFGTDNGVFIYTENRFIHFSTANGFPNFPATWVIPSRDGSMYVQFIRAVFHVRLSSKPAEKLGDSLIFLDEPFSTGGYRIDVDTSGAVWYSVKEKGVVKRIGSNEYIDKRFANVNPKEIFILPNQQKWVMTPQGVYLLENNEIHNHRIIDGIDCSSITSVFEDREGILWIAVEGAGLIRLRAKQVETITVSGGLQTNEIMCGMEDRAGTVWIGTWLGGLSYRKPGGKKFAAVPLLSNGTSIMAMSQSVDGMIWVGTWAHGVYIIDHGKVKKFLGKGLTDVITIRSIVSDPRGGVWIASAYGAIGYYNGEEEKIWDSQNGLPNFMINSLLLAKNGDIWSGTDGGGVIRISKGIVSILNSSNGLIDNFVHVSIEDNNRAVWLASRRGLQRYLPVGSLAGNNGMLSTVNSKHGFDDDPAQFTQDVEGNYWIGGTHGIHRIRNRDLNEAADGTLPSLSYLTIGKSDGMPVLECSGGNNQHVWKTSDSALWFSTTHGAVRIDPRSVASNPVPPGVIIEQVQIENLPVALDSEIIIHPQETKIEFHYTGINFSAPEHIRFKYILEGFDDHWRDVANVRFAQYTNLAPGRYTFRVKAVNNAGIWNEEGASIDLLVLPPFYATWWFRALFVIFFFTVGPSIYFLRVRQLKREKEKQVEFSRRLIESQESERKRIAGELHDGLGQNLLIIKNKLLVALSSKKTDGESHHIEEASDVVSSTIEEVRSISHNLRPHQLDQLGITKTLRSIVRQAKESTPIEFSTEIQDIDGALSSEEEINLFRIVQEAFNNIIKHSGATKVNINIFQNENSITVKISDNGKGISSSAGFGISGMHERAKMFGWKLIIESNPNQGTSLSIIL